jgi:hypothetical protein
MNSKITFMVAATVAFFSSTTFSAIDSKLNSYIELIVRLELSEDFPKNEIGKEICMASGIASYNCNSATTTAKGICLAGGIASYNCNSATTLAKGICLAGGIASYNCNSATTLAKGICLARGIASYSCGNMSLAAALELPLVDTSWKWDQFRRPNSFGNIWSCRGTATGQFADESKCFGEFKSDNTWPNN